MSEAAEERSNAPERGRRTPIYRRLTLSLSAFIMSLTITLLNAFYGLRGAEIVVEPPGQILLYRDGEGDNAVLTFAVRLPMINTAASYGDLMLEAALQPGPGAPGFKYQALVRPVFTDRSEEALGKCDLESRCIARPGLFVSEQADEIIDIPAGQARSRYFAFTLAEWNCQGPKPDCAAFRNFPAAAARIGSKPLDVEITLRFNSDGKRRILCRGGAIDLRYLNQVGWVNLSCQTQSVKGDNWL